MARVEWAWLESYHAADASALALADLAGLDEAELLGLAIRRHPATNVVVLASDAAPLVDPKFAADTRVLLVRSEEHTSELQSLMRISYAVFCLKKKKNQK